MKWYFILLLLPIELFGQTPYFFEISNLNPPFDKKEYDLILQINDYRMKNGIKPLKPHNVLNYHSKKIGKIMSTKNVDTTLHNTNFFYISDTFQIDRRFLVDSMDFIGLSIQPHQYYCEILVVSYDKKKRNITWVDIECPKQIPVEKKRKLR